jgi:hypothetical protein
MLTYFNNQNISLKILAFSLKCLLSSVCIHCTNEAKEGLLIVKIATKFSFILFCHLMAVGDYTNPTASLQDTTFNNAISR